eukprot:EG_transcript_23535
MKLDVRAKLRQYLDDNATEWIFDNNCIGDAGAQLVAEALHTNTTVQKIKLHSNALGPEGAKALAEALQTNATLREVDLTWNAIGPEGAKALAEALQTNATLREVRLGCNNIGPAGAKALAEALRTNATLQVVDLGTNEIGNGGARALRDALEHNTTLQHIGLFNNKISDALYTEIGQLLARKRKKPSNDQSTKPADDCAQVPPEAYQAGLLDAVQSAVEAGASLAATTAEGQTALQPAAQPRDTVVVDVPATQGPEGPQPLAAEFW